MLFTLNKSLKCHIENDKWDYLKENILVKLSQFTLQGNAEASLLGVHIEMISYFSQAR